MSHFTVKERVINVIPRFMGDRTRLPKVEIYPKRRGAYHKDSADMFDSDAAARKQVTSSTTWKSDFPTM